MPLIDIHSEIQEVRPAVSKQLGMPVLVLKNADVEAAGNVYKEFRTIKELKDDAAFASVKDDAALNAKLNAIFQQKKRHEKFAVLLYKTDIKEALEENKDADFYYILTVNDDPLEQKVIAEFVHLADDRQAIVRSFTAELAKAFNTFKRVISFVHPESLAAEKIDAAAVAEIGSYAPGEATWKFKKLEGITAQRLTTEEMQAIDDAKGIAYAYKHRADQTTEGWNSFVSDTAIAPDYVDDFLGIDWIKRDSENRIAETLRNTPKLPYDSRGINVLLGDVNISIKQAAEMGIVGVDSDGQYVYEVWAATRDEQTESDILNRKYKGINYRYRKSGAIHEVWLYGTVTF